MIKNNFFWFVLFTLTLTTGVLYCDAQDDQNEDYPRGGPGGSMVQLGPVILPTWLTDKNTKTQTPLKGRCEIIPSVDSNISVPCENVNLALLDSSGKELESARTQRGKFSFNRPSMKGYKLVVSTPKYKIKAQSSNEPKEEFVLTLIRK